MKISFKCLPVGSLPYDNISYAVKMMMKLFEKSPFLPLMPMVNPEDTLLNRTIEGIPGIHVRPKKIIIKTSGDAFKQDFLTLDKAFSSPDMDILEQFKIKSCFMEKFLLMMERLKPAETVVNLYGPFSLLQKLENKEIPDIIADKSCRKLVIEAICAKALWMIGMIKAYSPDTLPIIMLEEPMLHKVGDVRRQNEEITREMIVNIFAKVTQKIKEYQGAVGIQCFEKCDWTISIEAGADIISFNAYNHPNNINILPETITNYLAGGGRINWAIVPVMNEATVKALNIDSVCTRFEKTVEGLVAAGVSERLIYSRAMVSVQGNLNDLPVIFAEKAMILSTQLAKRVAAKRFAPLPQPQDLNQ